MATIPQIARNAVKMAFKVFADIATTCTYKRVNTAAYDPTTGITGDEDTVSGVRVIVPLPLNKFDIKSMPDENFRQGDGTALIPAVDLDAIGGGIGMSDKDYFTTSGGTVWHVISLLSIPVDNEKAGSEALIKIHVRRKAK